MGQTILCEVIAAWEETGEQPDFTQYGFASVLSALQEAQAIMFELGTSYNRLREKLDSQQSAVRDVPPALLSVHQTLVLCPQCGCVHAVALFASQSTQVVEEQCMSRSDLEVCEYRFASACPEGCN